MLAALLFTAIHQGGPTDLVAPPNYWATAQGFDIASIRTNDVIALVKLTGHHAETRGDWRFAVDEFSVVDGGGTLNVPTISVLTLATPVFQQPGTWRVPAAPSGSATYLLIGKKPSNTKLQFCRYYLGARNPVQYTECASVSSSEVAGAALLPTTITSLPKSGEYGSQVLHAVLASLKSHDDASTIAAVRFFMGLNFAFPPSSHKVDGLEYLDWVNHSLIPSLNTTAPGRTARVRMWLYAYIPRWARGTTTATRDAADKEFLKVLSGLSKSGYAFTKEDEAAVLYSLHGICPEMAFQIAESCSSPELRRYMLSQIGLPQDEPTLRRFLKFLNDPSPSVVDHAMNSLARWAGRTDFTSSDSPVASLKVAWEQRKAKLIPQLSKIHLPDLQNHCPSVKLGRMAPNALPTHADQGTLHSSAKRP